MNDESPSLNSREECGSAGGATNLLHSAVMKHVFSYVFTKIISIQVGRHNAGNDAVVRYWCHCDRILVQVALILAQL
jgi:hypothetical protein